MTEPTSRGYWGVTVVLLIWGLAYAWLTLFGLVLATPDDFAELVARGRILPGYPDYIARIPPWAVGVTFVCAASRLMGAVGLCLRRAWATAVYSVSLVCVLIIMIRGFAWADVTSVIRPSQVGVELLFLAASVFAVGFSSWASRRGTLR